jgi:hypothetical protein
VGVPAVEPLPLLELPPFAPLPELELLPAAEEVPVLPAGAPGLFALAEPTDDTFVFVELSVDFV